MSIKSTQTKNEMQKARQLLLYCTLGVLYKRLGNSWQFKVFLYYFGRTAMKYNIIDTEHMTH